MPQPLCMWMVTERGARTTQTDGYPSYHLASVVDDAHMRISHGFLPPFFFFICLVFLFLYTVGRMGIPTGFPSCGVLHTGLECVSMWLECVLSFSPSSPLPPRSQRVVGVI